MTRMILIAATGLLAACGSSQQAGQSNKSDQDFAQAPLPGEGSVEDNALQPIDEGSAGSPAQGPDSAIDETMEWRFDDRATGASLAYGEPQTDNVRLSLRCDADMVRLSFMRSAEMVDRRPRQLTIESGGMQWKSDISAQASELGGMSIAALIPQSAAAMTAFKAGNPLKLVWGAETIRVPPTDQAGRFLDACG